MANRSTLALSEVPSFSKWLEKKGWEIQPLKGKYELFRARHEVGKHPIILYKKKGAKFCTVLDRDLAHIQDFKSGNMQNKQSTKTAQKPQSHVTLETVSEQVQTLAERVGVLIELLKKTNRRKI